jgi:hypothetical protein
VIRIGINACQTARMKRFCLIIIAGLAAGSAAAEPVSIVQAMGSVGPTGWGFDVTLRHPDTGWDHYADAWEVLAPDGTSLGVRELAHPHEAEQPFTRSLSGITIPAGVNHVLIRARCNVDGWGEERLQVDVQGQ